MRNFNDLKNKRSWRGLILPVVLGLAAMAILIYQIPDVQARLNWRLEIASTYINGVFDPVHPLPTAQVLDPGSLAPNPAPQGGANATPQAGVVAALPPEEPTPTLAATATPQGGAT